MKGGPAFPILALAAFGAALAVGCGASKAGADAYGESRAVVVLAASVTVDMKDLRFQPQGIRVRPGTTVTWVNKDAIVHNVRQVQSAFLSPNEMKSGDSFSFTFDKPGSYRYQCTFHHPAMNGVVIVEEK